MGSILALDLRLLGLGRAIPIQPMAQLLLPLSCLGFLLANSISCCSALMRRMLCRVTHHVSAMRAAIFGGVRFNPRLRTKLS